MTELERLRAALAAIHEHAATVIRPDAMPTLDRIARLANEALNPPPTSGRPELTDRQAEVLETIRQFRGENGYGPTVRDLMKALKTKSPNGVMCHLNAIEKKGYLKREPCLSRSMVLVP